MNPDRDTSRTCIDIIFRQADLPFLIKRASACECKRMSGDYDALA
jgi:hypothetical protein